ncbi:Aerobic glycerol-3-phosphate dehydrogenase [Aquisphaera giovannonii]|uniref:Aerobic glycerol-3-phosphate dehydrogenase n=1 Tax=Aquisphaera giovannonii TaxID=406548 RepID=A0A5B9W995_9BACT|nr:glycerol-3-phosphate dehydrogenase/oxidase [Aquisphaera giovannonii]QEH37152.1 Aerobic glycerol-3-phosphate dehydrogenase [Aquisphaera giovannonii]
MNRDEMMAKLSDRSITWDVVVIGGGATGIGVAVDAAARGYRTALLERSDFGKGTSSRSTKLVHGGVRYLQQGNVSLVIEALRERGLLMKLAPHLVGNLRFVVPNYAWWEAPFYGIGMKVYDLLAGRYGFGPSKVLSREQTLALLPTIRTDGLRGGVQYFDGLFDDSRLLINLAQTAFEHGATVANYVRVDRLLKDAEGLIRGVVAQDLEAGAELELSARVVVNATGPFADALRRADDPSLGPIIAPSQGAHVVLPKEFLPGDSAIMVPHTADGRVMFAIPWHGHVVVGTTDVPIDHVPVDPAPMSDEVDFILETAAGYLARPATRADVRSAFAGIRPLVRAGEGTSTAALSRDHHLEIAPSGLVTICGGKWTTYRHMAEDTVDQAAIVGGLPERPCPTRELFIHGSAETLLGEDPLSVYGSDAIAIRSLARSSGRLAGQLHPDLPIVAAQVAWAAQQEMARTVEDVLCRRTRAAFLNAPAALAMAADVASILAAELGRDDAWAASQVEAFRPIGESFVAS